MQEGILGTIYTKVSADFQRGIYPIARCIKAETHDLAVVYAVRGADVEVKVIGQMDNTIDHTFESANRVYDTEGLAPTMNTCGGGGLQPKIIIAMRGRNPDNPSDRTAGNPTEQRLEPNSQGICNTLTSVQKDNMVLETISQYKIRRLTPLECWRLMGFSDEDFSKAEQVNSNTQLYKQAGNSIVKNVLMAILGQMIYRK